jgi:hypothetical protein
LTNPANFVTNRFISSTPAAHSLVYDSFTGKLVLFGDSHISLIDPSNPTVLYSDRVFPGETFDQGAVDGQGHIFAASNRGDLVFVDISTTGKLETAAFVNTRFLAFNLDDVAPLSGAGSQPAAPVVTCVPINPIAGAPFSGVVASFTDADNSTITSFTAKLDWGDGTTTTGTIVANGNGGFNINGSHTYATHGPFTLNVEVDDTDGTSGKGTCPLTVTATGQLATPNQNATGNFWAGPRGQTLLNSFNGGPSSTALSAWLASSFPNLYGAGAGANNLTGRTNGQVAALFETFSTESRPKPDAQALTLALDMYATTLSLGGTAGMAYGFSVTSTGLGASFVLLGSNGAAFDAADNQGVTAYYLLKAANAHAVNGVLYSGNSLLLQEFLNVVIDLNDTGMNG